MRARTRSIGHQPGVRVRASGGYGVVELVHPGGVVRVRRALVRLGVEDAVRMHAVRNPAGVAEHDFDGVADLGADHRAQKAQIRILREARRQTAEAGVGVTTVETLEVTRPDPAGPGLDVCPCYRVECLAGDSIASLGGVVPDHLVSTDVIGAHSTGRVELLAGGVVPVG